MEAEEAEMDQAHHDKRMVQLQLHTAEEAVAAGTDASAVGAGGGVRYCSYQCMNLLRT